MKAIQLHPAVSNIIGRLPLVMSRYTTILCLSGLIILGASFSLSAQNGVVKGTVQDALSNEPISFANILGSQGVFWISVCIAIQLIATISSYVWVGARITQAMAAEHPLWTYLSVKNKSNIPVRAIWLQALISIVCIKIIIL